MNYRAKGSKKLRAAQRTPHELSKLIAIPDRRPRSAERFDVEYRSGDVDDGDSYSGLAAAADFADYGSVKFRATYGLHDFFAVDIVSGRPTIRWEGPIGADIARQFEYRWNELPGRARFSYNVVRIIKWVTLVASGSAVGAWTLTHLAEIADDPMALVWPVPLPAAALIVGIATWWMIDRRDSAFIAVRAHRLPFVIERAVPIWRDTRFVITALLSAVGAVAALIGAVAVL